MDKKKKQLTVALVISGGLIVVMSLLLGRYGFAKTEVGLIGDGLFRASTEDTEFAYFDDEAINQYIGVPLAGDISDEDTTLQTVIAETCAEVNALRVENGLNELRIDNGALADTAVVRANECFIKWSHIRPNGKKWYTVNSKVQFGENLAYGYDNADSVVSAWMESPTHRENILYPDFKSMAIRVYVKDGIYYWAQEFNYN